MSNPVLEAALSYAARGWYVLPLRGGTKVPATRNGKLDASRDPVVVAGWFDEGSSYGVGILTGTKSGIIVVDIDPRNGGDASFAALEAQYGALPATLEAKTGGGGRHLIYALPPGTVGLHDRPNVGGFKGTDIKADGYIVGAPSGHPSGGSYEWINDPLPAPAPAFLVELARGSMKDTASSSQPRHGAIDAGGRNDTLFREGCRLQGLGVSEVTLRAAIAAENVARCNPPLDESEVDQIVQSALRYQPNAVPLSDLALARMLVTAFAGDFRYDHAASVWMAWTGKCWRPDRDGGVMRRAKAAVADRLVADADLIEDADIRKRARAAAKSAGSSRSLGAMIDLARSEPGVPFDGNAVDADPHGLNVANGVADLRTGGVRPHDPEAYHSKLIPIDYDPLATAPRWTLFVSQIAAGDADLARYLQKVFGMAATGVTTAQVFHILLGAGANGKSLLLNTISYVLADYAHVAPAALLLDKGAGAATNDLVALKGARLVTLSEFPGRGVIDAGQLKRLTGSEMITGRKLFQEFETFQPVAKFVWALNHMPSLDIDDSAIWRRVKVVPFARIFQPDEQDPNLSATLRAEASGILRWIVEGAVAWVREGLGTCEAVETATAAARLEGDEVGAFLAECCEEGAALVEDAGGLFRTFQMFAGNNGITVASPTAFGRSMTRRGFTAGKRGGRRVRQGLKLRAFGAGR